MRTLRATYGDRDYIWFTATELTGKDITSDSAVVGFGGADAPPAVEIVPDGASDIVQHPSPSTIRVGLFVAADAGTDGAHVITPGRYYGWIKPADTPSAAWVRCGSVTII